MTQPPIFGGLFASIVNACIFACSPGILQFRELIAIATEGFGLPNLIEGQAEHVSLAGNQRFDAEVKVIRASRSPCEDDPRFHAFDFWTGEWRRPQFPVFCPWKTM